jgi:serine-type D-Ala-D-Ala carboxypeptidase/endopeptidase (penicillin-binding protein 4)
VRPLLLALAALLTAVPGAVAGDREKTRQSIERHMRAAGAGSGAFAIDLDSGRTIAAVRAGAGRVPASVQKLYTTSAALLRHGPDGQLATRLYTRTPPDATGRIAGPVWIRGSGDPALDGAGVASLGAEVAAAGITRIDGDLYADESAFDTLRGPPSEGYRSSRWVAPLSGLAFEGGRHGAVEVPRALKQSLRAQGVGVPGRPRLGTTPAGATALGEIASPPMATLAARTNIPSDNWYAEQLLKALPVTDGAHGTTASGAATARATLRRAFGIRPRISDGSGLSRANRTTPRQVVRLLRGMEDIDEGRTLRASLAVAGRSGTVRDRMRRNAAAGRCQVKTGTLSNVSALAGYCTSRRGARTAFAFLMNGVYTPAARRLQDKMAGALARYSGR